MTNDPQNANTPSLTELPALTPAEAPVADAPPKAPRLEPTRYGDWELNGKCVDF